MKVPAQLLNPGPDFDNYMKNCLHNNSYNFWSTDYMEYILSPWTYQAFRSSFFKKRKKIVTF